MSGKTGMKKLGGEYRESAKKLLGRIEALERKRKTEKIGGPELEELNFRIVTLKAMYCDTACIGRFLENYGQTDSDESPYIGLSVVL